MDHEWHLIRYRGRPRICNHRPAKRDRTDSHEGREVVRSMDPWPYSEAGRFHRGISSAVALIAALILAAGAAHNHSQFTLVILGAASAVVALVTRHLHAAFRMSSADFPNASTISPSSIPKKILRTGYRKG